MSATVPCTRMFSSGMEFEWFLEHNCEKCRRYRNGKCKIYNACWATRWDKTKFPYDYLLDYADGYGGKVCKLFTEEPIKREKKEHQIAGQMRFEEVKP